MGREQFAVALYGYSLAVKGVDAPAEPAEAVPVNRDLLVDRHDGHAGAGVEEGAVEAGVRRVALYGGAGGLHGGVASGDGGVGVVVVAGQEAWQVAGDGLGRGDAVGAGGVVAGLVCHGQGEVVGEGRCLRLYSGEGIADGAVVALVASDAPWGLGRGGPPMDAHGVDGVEEGVVLVCGAAVGDEGPAGSPDREPREIQHAENDLAAHGGDESALAKVRLQVRDVRDLRQCGCELEYVFSQDAVESVRRFGHGVARTAGKGRVLLAEDAGVGDRLEAGDVGGGEGVRRKVASDGLDAGVAKLAVGLLHLRAGVVSGSAGGGERGRGQGEVAAVEAAGDGRAGGAGVEDVGGRVEK